MTIISKVICKLCNKRFESITHSHVMKYHSMSLTEYVKMFPDDPLHAELLPECKDEKELLLDAVLNTFEEKK